MPRAKGTANKSKNTAPKLAYAIKPHRDCEWGGFVNIPMHEGDKEDFEKWQAQEVETIYVYLSNTLIQGMKFSVTHDNGNSCFIATFTGTAYEGSELLMSMSARAESVEEATALLLYKHGILAGGLWNEFVDAKRGFSWG